MPEKLSSREAAELLGIKEATLYAYVSRGMIRSIPADADDDPRTRYYAAGDVHALVHRKSVRRDPSRGAEDALNWGTPVLTSALTRIADGRLFYRGRDAAVLAREARFEDVLTLLWQSGMPAPQNASTFSLLAVPSLEMLQSLVIQAALEDARAFDTSSQGAAATGWRIIRLLTGHLTNADGPVASALASAYGGEAALYDAALILCADHELNASSFTARVIASTGAHPYAVVAGAMAALSGPKHGGMVLRVHALLQEAVGQPERVLFDRMRRGEAIPAVGHTLYPEGDPRYKALMAVMRDVFGAGSRLAAYRAVAEAAQAATGRAPTIDFALAVLLHMLGQPAELGAALFALGRTGGWIAHAIEQYGDGQLIRPRAKYVGE